MTYANQNDWEIIPLIKEINEVWINKINPIGLCRGFTNIYSFPIEKDGRASRNISIQFPCVCVCLSFCDLFNSYICIYIVFVINMYLLRLSRPASLYMVSSGPPAWKTPYTFVINNSVILWFMRVQWFIQNERLIMVPTISRNYNPMHF